MTGDPLGALAAVITTHPILLVAAWAGAILLMTVGAAITALVTAATRRPVDPAPQPVARADMPASPGRWCTPLAARYTTGRSKVQRKADR